MKTMNPLLKAYLDSGANIAFRADLFTLTLIDGVTVYRWTTSEVPLTVGGNTYLSSGSAAPDVRRSTFSNAKLPTIDQISLTLTGGAFKIAGVSLTQIAALGYFDGARVRVDHLLGPDIVTAIAWGGIQSLFEGRVGDCSPSGANLVMPLASESVALRKMIPFVVLTPSCAYSVYDTNCGLSAAAFTLSGAASGVPTKTNVPTTSAALTAKAAGYFDLGVITWTSGVLNGTTADVESWNGISFTLSLSMVAAPAAGDTFSVYPGCHLTRADCGGKFSNIGPTGHWRGFNHIPSPESGSH